MSQSIIKNHEIEDFLCPIYKTLQLDGTQKKKKNKKNSLRYGMAQGFPILVLVQAQEQRASHSSLAFLPRRPCTCFSKSINTKADNLNTSQTIQVRQDMEI